MMKTKNSEREGEKIALFFFMPKKIKKLKKILDNYKKVCYTVSTVKRKYEIRTYFFRTLVQRKY